MKNAPAPEGVEALQTDTAESTTTSPRKHHVWIVQLAGVGEFRAFFPTGVTVDEAERIVRLRFPGGVLQRLRPTEARCERGCR